MKNILLLTFLFVSSFTCFAQQADTTTSGPRVFFDNGELQIEPATYTIVNYKVSLVRRGMGEVGPYMYSSDRPSPDVHGVIKLGRTGDKLYFNDIKVKGTDGQIKDHSSIAVKIK